MTIDISHDPLLPLPHQRRQLANSAVDTGPQKVESLVSGIQQLKGVEMVTQVGPSPVCLESDKREPLPGSRDTGA